MAEGFGSEMQELKVKSPGPDYREIKMKVPVPNRYDSKPFELPLPEMKRQELAAQKGKRGVEKSIGDQRRRTTLGDQVRAIYDNRNHPG